jgi:hypothetical protein
MSFTLYYSLHHLIFFFFFLDYILYGSGIRDRDT